MGIANILSTSVRGTLSRAEHSPNMFELLAASFEFQC